MRVNKYVGDLLTVLGIFFLILSLITFSTSYVDPRVHVMAFFISIFSIIFIIIGISIRRIGNKQIRKSKERKQIASDLNKDRRIKELEKRLDKVEELEKDKEKED